MYREQFFTESTKKGLTTEQVLVSQQRFGLNVLTPPKRESIWKLYCDKFRDPIIIILLVAAAISLILSFLQNDYVETLGIVAAIFFATTVGFYFERDATKKFDLLTTLDDQQPVKVRRNGHVQTIDRRNVAVGDIVIIETGDEVPADGTLLNAVNLQIDESSLTGELLTSKHAEQHSSTETYAENHVLRSTMVVNGRGEFVVTAVGDQTEIGSVARKATELTGIKTPLKLQLERLAKLISKIGGAVSVLTFVLFLLHNILTNPTLWHSNNYLGMAEVVLQYFMMAVTLIVMAVPEGLPMAVTLALALNMRRMLKSKILVRSLHASETVGAVTVICTDKTGTLTENRMQVKQFFSSTDTSTLLPSSIAVNTTANLNDRQTIGNPTEGALLRWIADQGANYEALRSEATIVAQLPFSTEKKYMATLADLPQGRYLFVKGAPEMVLSMCTIAPGERAKTEKALLEAQKKGLRTLALACKAIGEGTKVRGDEGATEQERSETSLQNELEGLQYQGFFAIEDPVRGDVPAAVKACNQAGIEVKIVTGDTTVTAEEVAKQIGVWNGKAITGAEWAALDDDTARTTAQEICLISRARPADKQRLVELLQQQGQVVAVTGDGTNDAPALHHAQVGLSLGSGTHVAKEASNMTLLDDSFSAIPRAVMWGRSLYKNLQRFLFFQLVVNVAALLLVLVGSMIGNEMPLTVTQILWVNLIMDTFAAMALASLPPSREVLKDKPRNPGDFIITPQIGRNILLYGLLVFAVMFCFLIYCERNGSEGVDIRELTQFFTTFVMLQVWNLFNAKRQSTAYSSFHRLWACSGFLIVLGLIVVGQWFIVQYGGEVFRTVPLTAKEWAIIIVGTSPILWIGELAHLLKRLCTTKHATNSH